MKIAITGAKGFIGKKICCALEKMGHEVLKFDLDNLDIRKEISLPQGIDVVYHLAAINKTYLSKKNPAETFKTNIFGTVNLLDAAKRAGVKKFIFTSSILAYKDLLKTKEDNPVGYSRNPYGFEKFVSEEYVKMYSELFGIEYVILRLSGVYGPGMYKNPVFDVMQGFLFQEKSKIFVNKNSIYNFIYIDDVVSALQKSLNFKNKIFNVASDKNIRIKDVYNLLKGKTGKDPGLDDLGDNIKILGNNKKLKRTGWSEKYPFEKGLLKTYNYFLKNGK